MTRGFVMAAAPINGFTFVIDYGDVRETQTLLLTCRGCGCCWYSDFEEKFCADCVKRRELLDLPLTATR